MGHRGGRVADRAARAPLLRVVLAGLLFATALVAAVAELWVVVGTLSVVHAVVVTQLGLDALRRPRTGSGGR